MYNIWSTDIRRRIIITVAVTTTNGGRVFIPVLYNIYRLAATRNVE